MTYQAIRKLYVLYFIVLLAMIAITHAQCGSGNWVKCCGAGTYQCRAAGSGCAPGQVTVNNGAQCPSGGGSSCSCRACVNDGDCVSWCGTTNYACYNRQCQRGTSDCTSGTGGDPSAT